MYQNKPYYYGYNNQSKPYYTNNDDRMIGAGFLGPFVLGGIAGGLAAPYFYRPYPMYPPRPYPMYPPYPRYW